MGAAFLLAIELGFYVFHLNAGDIPEKAPNNCALNSIVADIFISLPETNNLTNSVLDILEKFRKIESEVRLLN